MKINFPSETDKCDQAVPCALMLDIAASIGELTRCFFLSVFFRSYPYITISHLPLIYICCILIKMSRSQNELGLSLVFLDGEGDHLLIVSCLQKSWRKMSTSTQDKTNTSLPLPQERNSYTSTPYLVLTACMARKKWPQGWLTHPILLVKVC